MSLSFRGDYLIKGTLLIAESPLFALRSDAKALVLEHITQRHPCVKRHASHTDLMRHKHGCRVYGGQQLSVRLADDVNATGHVITPLEVLREESFVRPVVH